SKRDWSSDVCSSDLGIGWLGVHLMDSGVAFSVSSMLSSIGIVSRKVLVPLSFVICLAGEPTGSLMAALQKLHLPKAAGIGTAVEIGRASCRERRCRL